MPYTIMRGEATPFEFIICHSAARQPDYLELARLKA